MAKEDSLRKRIKGHFFSGLLVVIPLLVSVYVLVQVLQWLYNALDPLFFVPEQFKDLLYEYLPDWFAATVYASTHLVEFAVVIGIILVLVSLLGMFTRIRLFNWLFGLGEKVVAKIPLMGIVYSAVKQLMQAVFSGKGNFSRVVMVQYPRPGVWCLAFVSREADSTFNRLAGEKLVSVFMPTTPNVTTGFLFMVSDKELIEVDLTVEQAFKIIISAGMVLAHEEPDVAGITGDTLIDRLARKAKEAAARAGEEAAKPEGPPGD
jgi:uncharacterized membrane protein